ncbi:hypothetical protein IMZ68_01915 [Candidatus Bathyarchaeota archaeon]|nr:hypothetical protein [Candidatus Bathyarchaeota archaeon]
MVLVEGFKLKAKQISKKQLVSTWKKLTDRPFPKIKALMVSDDDFDHVMRQRHCLEDDLREIEEWGRILSTKGTDACVFNAEQAADADYIILVRQNPYHSLEEIIQHELSHIARGDL